MRRGEYRSTSSRRARVELRVPLEFDPDSSGPLVLGGDRYSGRVACEVVCVDFEKQGIRVRVQITK